MTTTSELSVARVKGIMAEDRGGMVMPERNRTDAKAGYAYAFVYPVASEHGNHLIRAVGTVDVPVAPRGDRPAFVGNFLVPKRSDIPRDATTALEIHAVAGGLYSRMTPILGSRLPEGFGKESEIADILAWKFQPRDGISGHPLHAALSDARGDSLEFRPQEYVCPPDWDVTFHGGGRDPNHVYSPLYGGRGSRSARHLPNPPPAPPIGTESDLRRHGLSALLLEGDKVRDEISTALEGSLAIVNGKVMLRANEPCWRLSLVKGGDLRLDLLLDEKIYYAESGDPSLYFSLDETAERDVAIATLLRVVERPTLRNRGNLATFDASACRIDGAATTASHLIEGIRECLHHAAKSLPDDAAAVALEIREQLPPRHTLPGRVHRGDTERPEIGNLWDRWHDMLGLAGDQVSLGSDNAWIKRLAAYGLVLSHLVEERSYDADIPKQSHGM